MAKKPKKQCVTNVVNEYTSFKMEKNHDNLAQKLSQGLSLEVFKKEEKMMILIRQGQVFAPEPLGKKDILILGSKIGSWQVLEKIFCVNFLRL